ncbi:hypothetical protein BGZ80_010640 [Entomortierella chlamydospora]|uniref:Uncharacterized protein n=1 Tax=Entomortierella chlamydospora TaxID=101097 RepID=A0A9P6SZQ5_9FUNG|nr:hypothetical protein BGZ80_010640 [Entomortierella chlamydospora]
MVEDAEVEVRVEMGGFDGSAVGSIYCVDEDDLFQRSEALNILSLGAVDIAEDIPGVDDAKTLSRLLDEEEEEEEEERIPSRIHLCCRAAYAFVVAAADVGGGDGWVIVGAPATTRLMMLESWHLTDSNHKCGIVVVKILVGAMLYLADMLMREELDLALMMKETAVVSSNSAVVVDGDVRHATAVGDAGDDVAAAAAAVAVVGVSAEIGVHGTVVGSGRPGVSTVCPHDGIARSDVVAVADGCDDAVVAAAGHLMGA